MEHLLVSLIYNLYKVRITIQKRMIGELVRVNVLNILKLFSQMGTIYL